MFAATLAALGLLGALLAHKLGKQVGRNDDMEFELMNFRALAALRAMDKRHRGAD